MASNRKLLYSIVGPVVLVTNCDAEPPPLPPETMRDYSDAVVVVDVLSVTHTGEMGLQDEPVYSVRMRVREVRKGELRVGRIMVWRMSNYQPPPGGYGGGVAYPGERLLFYLKRYPNGAYNTWGHNCTEDLLAVTPKLQRLPKQPGATVYAFGHVQSGANRERTLGRIEMRRRIEWSQAEGPRGLSARAPVVCCQAGSKHYGPRRTMKCGFLHEVTRPSRRNRIPSGRR